MLDMSHSLAGPQDGMTNNHITDNKWIARASNVCMVKTLEDLTSSSSSPTPLSPSPLSSLSIDKNMVASYSSSSSSSTKLCDVARNAKNKMANGIASSSSPAIATSDINDRTNMIEECNIPSSTSSGNDLENCEDSNDIRPMYLLTYHKVSSSATQMRDPTSENFIVSPSSSCQTIYLSLNSPSFASAPPSNLPTPSLPDKLLVQSGDGSPTPEVSMETQTELNCDMEDQPMGHEISNDDVAIPYIFERSEESKEMESSKSDGDHKSLEVGEDERLQNYCRPISSSQHSSQINSRADTSIQLKPFVNDSSSIGQHGHVPFSDIVSLCNSSPFSYPVSGHSSKTSHSSSTFGGLLARLKDVFPSRGSTSDLSKMARLEKSTTALILQDRQPGLPSKAQEEEARHRIMYESIVVGVKKKEKKEERKNVERMKNQLKMEELMSSALKVWKRDLLPYWDDVKTNYNTRQLWWHGIPPSIRGVVWKLVIGNDLNITKELYEICLQRFQELLKTSSSLPSSTSSSTSASPSLSKMAAKRSSPSSSSSSLAAKNAQVCASNDCGSLLLSPADCKEKDNTVSRESSIELIRLDVSRTFPSLCIFQKVGPYHEYLEGLLGAYVCYRPDVGYVQGMSFVAAILLLNMEVDDAFICFANLLNRPVFITFFRLDADMMKVYFHAYNFFLKNNMPKLYKHFLEQKLTADLYIIDWVFSLYSKCFNLDIVSRIWDVFFRDGEQFLFRTALGILKLFQCLLLEMDFIQMAQFLVRPPESRVDQAELFQSIESIDMECKGLSFRQVLEQFKVNNLGGQ